MAISRRPTAYDGTALETSDLSVYLEVTFGLNEQPDVRGSDSVVPHADGAISRNRRAHDRRILLSGWVSGVGSTTALVRASYQNTFDTLFTLFATDRVPADLVVTSPDATTRTIEARPLNIAIKEVVLGEFAEVTVEMLSVAPNWTVT
jgi:hypothetical protein